MKIYNFHNIPSSYDDILDLLLIVRASRHERDQFLLYDSDLQ